MVYKRLVPKSMIPKIYPLCPECGSGMRTTVATPYAAGYYRRHVCLDTSCGRVLHSLASYTDGTYDTSPVPYKDRPLTEYEEDLRDRWAEDAVPNYRAEKLPVKVNNPLLRRMALALDRDEGLRNEADKFLVSAYNAILVRFNAMEKQKNG